MRNESIGSGDYARERRNPRAKNERNDGWRIWPAILFAAFVGIAGIIVNELANAAGDWSGR